MTSAPILRARRTMWRWFCRRQRRNPDSSSPRLNASASCQCAGSVDAKQRFSIRSGILNNIIDSFRIGQQYHKGVWAIHRTGCRDEPLALL